MSHIYYDMLYIEGETLHDGLNREMRLVIDETVDTITEVGDALDYTRRHNVIHHDIKPDNILLHPKGTTCCISKTSKADTAPV